MSVSNIEIPKEKIKSFCNQWKIIKLSLFGSVLRHDFYQDSDIDVLAVFSPDVRYSLFDKVRIQAELGMIFGREVDLVDIKAVEQSENYIRRKHILSSTETIYVAG